MKRYIYLYFIFIGIMVSAQESTNRFEQAEYNAATGAEVGKHDDEQPPVTGKNTPSNPGDPVPIDDYLPLLISAAVGLIAYKGYKKKYSA